MEKKIYKLRIGTRKSTLIKGWDLLDAKVKYIKKIGLWSQQSNRQNQQNIDAVVEK